MKAQNPIGLNRLILAMLLPLVAFALQSIFWTTIKPFAWFLFFPAVFFSSWIAGLPGGVIATFISTALAWWAFIPPEYSFVLEDPFQLVSIGLFMGMGFLFGYSQERIKKANRETAEALGVARSANDQLETANKELEAFSYSVSHDLRAPVRHIHGYAELLQKSASSALDEKSRHYLTTILDSGKQMATLIDELLSFSRMGQAEMRKINVSLDELFKEALKTLAPEMNGRSIVWKIDRLPQLYGDPTMLRLVLTNLVSNALKFTHKREDAKIEVGSMNSEQDHIVIFIRDNGVGFDMRYADKLFGIFQRLHREEEFEGTGIGLANVRRIIHRHGGRTWAEGSLNGGATFYFLLPKFQKGEQSWPS